MINMKLTVNNVRVDQVGNLDCGRGRSSVMNKKFKFNSNYHFKNANKHNWFRNKNFDRFVDHKGKTDLSSFVSLQPIRKKVSVGLIPFTRHFSVSAYSILLTRLKYGLRVVVFNINDSFKYTYQKRGHIPSRLVMNLALVRNWETKCRLLMNKESYLVKLNQLQMHNNLNKVGTKFVQGFFSCICFYFLFNLTSALMTHAKLLLSWKMSNAVQKFRNKNVKKFILKRSTYKHFKARVRQNIYVKKSINHVFWHSIFNNILINSFINSFLISGKKEKMEQLTYTVLLTLKRTVRRQPIFFVSRTFELLQPIIDTYSITRAGKQYAIPRMLKPRRRLTFLLRFFRSLLRNSNKNICFNLKFVPELIAAGNNRGPVRSKVFDLQRSSYQSRINLRFIRRRRRKRHIFI